MFFLNKYGKKREDEEQILSEQLAEQRKEARQWTETISARLDRLEERQQAGEKQLRRQSESFEDVLEELQEREQEQKYFQTQLGEYVRREQELLALADCCRGHFQLLKQRILADPGLNETQKTAWERQLQMMEQEATSIMRRCGMEEVGLPGEAVDYETCEVLDIKECTDETQAGTIAQVYRPGRIYQGRLLVKAQVSAYRLKKTEGEQT